MTLVREDHQAWMAATEQMDPREYLVFQVTLDPEAPADLTELRVLQGSLATAVAIPSAQKVIEVTLASQV